jgi:hypothetical protein
MSHVFLHFGWALWLAAPILATVLAAVWTWWRGRAPKLASTRTGMAAHRAYLDALARPPAVGTEFVQEQAR